MTHNVPHSCYHYAFVSTTSKEQFLELNEKVTLNQAGAFRGKKCNSYFDSQPHCVH